MYYIDVRKDIDYDAKIEERADSLDKGILDRYYFEVLAGVMKTPGSTYVPGYRIRAWSSEEASREAAPSSLSAQRTVDRPTATRRASTSQPYDRRSSRTNCGRMGLLQVSRMNETFRAALGYMPAREMFTNSSRSTATYGARRQHLKTITKWLQKHHHRIDVTCRGDPAPGWLARGINTRGYIGPSMTSQLLSHFERYLDYPISQVIRSKARRAMKMPSSVPAVSACARRFLTVSLRTVLSIRNSLPAHQISSEQGVGQVLNGRIIGGRGVV